MDGIDVQLEWIMWRAALLAARHLKHRDSGCDLQDGHLIDQSKPLVSQTEIGP